MASTRLTRTPSSNGNDKIATLSMWIKRSRIDGTQQNLFTSGPESERTQIFFTTDETLHIQAYSSSSATTNVITNRKFRDPSAWYHIVIAFDSTQSSADDRIKLYVNGVQETSFGTNTRQSQNGTFSFNQSSRTVTIGNYLSSSYYFKGSMSHLHWIDGTAYAASNFGSTDSATGEWKINTGPTLTYGTNGFFILKDGNSVTDQSGNGNNLTVASGTLTKTEDNPSNNFCTLNPVTQHTYNFSNGANTIVRSGSASTTIGTIATAKGKWYWEVKLVSGQSNYPRIGIFKSNADNHIHTTYLGNTSGGTGKWWGSGGSGSGNNVIADGNSSTTAFYSYTNGDILMFAMDNDNGKLWFGNNGTWYTNDNSTTTTGSAITAGSATPAFSTVTTGAHWTPAIFGNDGADVWSANFGNGYFGTTAVASAGTNASGIGIFEYDVPVGYNALCTKGLNL